MTTPDYSIRALNYAHISLPTDFMAGVPLHSNQGMTPIAMHYVLLSWRDEQGGEHHHLVDCGFEDPVWIERNGFTDWESPETCLARVGLTPADIESVFVTHMHFDHVNALGRYRHADVYVQRAEYEGWHKVIEMPERFFPQGDLSWLVSSLHRDDVALFDEFAERGKLHLVEDGVELLPGVVGHLSPGGHTFGIQWLSVETSNGPFAIASDTVMGYGNLNEMWPAGYTNGDSYQSVLTYAEILDRVGGDLNRVLPGHDLEMYERFPSWQDGVHKVAELHVADWDVSRSPS